SNIPEDAAWIFGTRRGNDDDDCQSRGARWRDFGGDDFRPHFRYASESFVVVRRNFKPPAHGYKEGWPSFLVVFRDVRKNGGPSSLYCEKLNGIAIFPHWIARSNEEVPSFLSVSPDTSVCTHAAA